MTAHYEDGPVQIWHGDCIDVMRQMPDASVDAVVTDPPYGLEFMGKDWDGSNGFRRSLNAADVGRDSVFGRTSATSPEYRTSSKAAAGFMAGGHSATDGLPSYLGGLNPKCRNCTKWQRGSNPCKCDAPDFPNERLPRLHEFQAWCELWAAECFRVLKPGGHLLAFGGTRTFHRLTAGVEDAGFEIRDSIAWLYGSGFPKSLDVSKAIDKMQRRDYVLAAIDLGLTVPGNNLHDWTKAEHSPGDAWWERFKDHLSDDDWGRLERAVTGKGTSGATAGMQLLGPSGIKGGEYDVTAPATADAARWNGWGTALKPAFEPIVVARKPLAGTVAANVLQHGTGALNIDGSRIGTEVRTAAFTSLAPAHGNRLGAPGTAEARRGTQGDPKEYVGRWPANVVLDESQAAALDAQSGVLTSGANPTSRSSDKFRDTYGEFKGQTEITPARGADSGGASRFFYTAKASTDERPSVDGIAHPTVKPVDLMRWLVKLVTPPGGTVLEPFAGSGTTVEAAVLEGFHCIAIEREADYLPLILKRIRKPHAVGLDFGEWEA